MTTEERSVLIGGVVIIGVLWWVRRQAESVGIAAVNAVGEFFEGLAWTIVVPPGRNQDIVDYWCEKGYTAENIANLVAGKVVIPFFGRAMSPLEGYDLLWNKYSGTKERDVWGGPFNLPIWGNPEYCIAQDWAAEQMENYTVWAEEQV